MSLDASLNFEQKSCRLIPAGPKTVPTGGAGVAFPAGICNLINLDFISYANKLISLLCLNVETKIISNNGMAIA